MAADQQLKNKRLKKLHIVNDAYMKRKAANKKLFNFMILAVFLGLIASVCFFK